MLKVALVPGDVLLSRSVVAETTSPSETAQMKVSKLYEERGLELLRFALALARDEELAKDAVQEAFMRYFVALCEKEEIASPRAWIYRVLHNYLLDRMKEARHASRRDIYHGLFVPDDREIERECFRQEIMRMVRIALTAREYNCLRLRTEGRQYDEIAAELKLTSGTVGALLSRAIRKLRRRLSPIGGA